MLARARAAAGRGGRPTTDGVADCRPVRGAPECVMEQEVVKWGRQPSRVLILASVPPALMATFTASSMGSLKGTSMRSNPFT